MYIFNGVSIAAGWLLLLVILLVIEIVTLGLTTIWFAGGSLVAFFAALLGAPLAVQIILFLVVSLILLFVTRPIAVKYFNRDRVKTNVESMIGRQGIVISPIDNLQGTGQVTVNGLEWSARAKEDGTTFQLGSVVVVTDVQGVKLIVEEKDKEL
ncbi:MAG: NfeD family protein [Lachnospiraceae bacterium]|nr:NfeD family protein [Lachnospiraceae bacterium]